MQYLGPISTGTGALTALGVDSAGTLIKVGNVSSTSSGLMSLNDKVKLDGILTNLTPATATATGMTWNGLPVYRQYFAGTFPNAGVSLTLISGASNLLNFNGWVSRSNGQRHLISLIGVDSTINSHISPVFWNANVIQMYNNASEAAFNGQLYQVSIEFTK